MGRKSKIDIKTKKKIIILRLQGLTVKEIAKKIGTSETTILTIIKKEQQNNPKLKKRLERISMLTLKKSSSQKIELKKAKRLNLLIDLIKKNATRKEILIEYEKIGHDNSLLHTDINEIDKFIKNTKIKKKIEKIKGKAKWKKETIARKMLERFRK